MVTVEVDEQVWRYLMRQKRPGDSHNDVLRRELGLADSPPAEHRERAENGRESGAVSRARDALADWEPENVDTQKARRATVAVVGWLAKQDGARQKAAIGEWYAGELAFSTAWQKAIRPGLRQLVEAGLVRHQRNVGYEIVAEEEGSED